MTTTDVARRAPATAVSIQPGQDMFDDKQRAALAVLGVKDATNADLAVFMHVCQRTGLDPFARQIYLIARREKQGDQWVTKQTIQVGIDGFRVIRDRAARRDGVDVEYEDTRWYDADGVAHEIWLRAEPPAGCGMTVLKGGRRYPAVLTFAEYVQVNREGKPTGKWRDAPAHQLEKCVEAFGLRRAFPQDLGGIYLPEETAPDELAAAGQAARPARAELVRERPARPAASPGAPAERDGGSPDPADSRDEPDADAAPARGQGKPTGAALGRLGKLLQQVPLGDPEAVAAYLEWVTGHPCPGLEALTRDDVTTVTQHLSAVLSGTEGDTEAAAGNIWTAYRDAHPEDGTDG